MFQCKKCAIYSIIFIALVIVMSGCTKESKLQPENQENKNADNSMNVSESQNEVASTSKENENKNVEKPVIVLNFADIKGWVVFEEENFNFSFIYPEEWKYNLKRNESNKSYEYNLIKSEFYNQNDDLVLVVSNMNPEVGYETYARLKHEVVGTNNEDSDLLLSYYALDNEISGIDGDFNMILLEWNKGKECKNPEADCLSGQLTGSTELSGNMIIVNYPRINNEYYKLIADKISKTFNFID